MPEAQALADRLIIIDHGVVALTGSISDVAQAVGVVTVISFHSRSWSDADRDSVGALPGVTKILADERNGRWTIDILSSLAEPPAREIRSVLHEDTYDDIVVREPTLEEMYLSFIDSRNATAHS